MGLRRNALYTLSNSFLVTSQSECAVFKLTQSQRLAGIRLFPCKLQGYSPNVAYNVP
jgi:hypothetical protein